ncbi:MAG TPA: hypothetical protein VFP93_03230 [Gammaproteobacteria bacterium]|nr:hypothetical protein [Gammaproteobacteria bacterium]
MLNYLWSFYRTQQKPEISPISINGDGSIMIPSSVQVHVAPLEMHVLNSSEQSLISSELEKNRQKKFPVNQPGKWITDADWIEVQHVLRSNIFKTTIPTAYKIIIKFIEQEGNYPIFQYYPSTRGLREKQRGCISFSSNKIWVRWDHISHDRWTNSHSLRDFSDKEEFLVWIKTLENVTCVLSDNALWPQLPTRFEYF